MAEFTGVFYGFYSNKSIDIVFDALKRKIVEMGYLYRYNKFKEEESLFAYRNSAMLQQHEKEGYNLDKNNEGCFCIEAKKVNLNGKALLTKLDEYSGFDPYEIELLFNNIYYYFLILPESVENSDFCAKIKNDLTNVINQIN